MDTYEKEKKFKHKNLYSSTFAYGIKNHKHLCEIDQELFKLTKKKISFTFNPHLLPTFRGILSSIYVETKNKVGVISYIKLQEDDTIKESPYIIIIPKEYMDDNQFESVKVNDKIKVRVKSYRIKYMAKQIQIVSELS